MARKAKGAKGETRTKAKTKAKAKTETKAKAKATAGNGRKRAKNEEANHGAKNGNKRGRKSSTAGLSYNFTQTDGGQVLFSGLPTGEKTPGRVADILVKYGFEETEPGQWIDISHPLSSEPTDEVLTALGAYAPVELALEPPKTKRSIIKYRVKIGAGNEAKADDMHVALSRAHKSWNKNGRDVKNIGLCSAIDRVMGA